MRFLKNLPGRFLSLMALLSSAFVSCRQSPLPSGNWEPYAHKALTALIANHGNSNKDYDSACKPYAVFDFDNTSIIGDIELTVMSYQLENLRFRIKPEDLFETLTKDLEDIDKDLYIEGKPGLTVRMLANDIVEDYKYLYDNYISIFQDKRSAEASKALKKISRSPEHQDFKAKVWALSNGVYLNYDYGIGCIWIVRLYNGMTRQEQRALVKEAAGHAISIKNPFLEKWESPGIGQSGKVSVSFMRGLGIPEEMKSLYKVLNDNGISTYICSAAEENIVETIACDKEYGLGIPPENVFGIRLALSKNGLVYAEYDTNYSQTYKEGKTKAILEYIAPLHCGNEPVLVAGDSNGDYDMLTAFKSLKAGLIIDCGNGGPIGELTMAAQSGHKRTKAPVYIVQGRNEREKSFIPEQTSIILE